MTNKNTNKELAELTVINAQLRQQIVDLEAKLKSAESSKDTWYRSYSTSESRAQFLQEIVDRLLPPREKARES